MHPTDKQIAARPHIRLWLYVVATLIFVMVVVGGATRLTDSGLSITEWQPIVGTIPPLSHADWMVAFEKYRQIPEYRLINRGMSLDDFKFIFWWEWAHRFLGRFIGVAFFVPMMWFWLTGRLEAALRPRLVVLFVLGGLQGALGWYMVQSGLVDNVDVSQYRLAAHLTLAAVIYAGVIWVALTIGAERTRPLRVGAVILVATVLLQIAAGGLVAGLDAGLAYNTWPLMDEKVIPDGMMDMSPAWVNFFDNVITVQFQHRMLGYFVVLAVVDEAQKSIRHGPDAAQAPAWTMVLVVLIQVALGIATLVAFVPLSLALMHQAGAFILLAVAVWHVHSAAKPSRR